MEMFRFRTSLRAMVSRMAATRRGRGMERVLVDLPSNVRADMGLDRTRNLFVPYMLGE